jgi:hypothetical protein
MPVHPLREADSTRLSRDVAPRSSELLAPRLRRWAALGAFVSLPSSAMFGQAICSAPHSSPTLAGGGSIGTLPSGDGWVMVSTLRQQSTRTFNSAGDRQPFLAAGRFRTTSAYLSAGVGLRAGLDVWMQAPVHVMHYQDDGGERSRVGLGDVRAALRFVPAAFGRSAPVALRVGAKVPGSVFPLDATVIPLTEGQRDLEVSLESGRAFRSGLVYVLGWVGQRWRAENRDAARKPGDEWFVHSGVGGTMPGSVRLELGVDALLGRPPEQLGFVVNASRRRLLQLTPTVGRRVGRGDLELSGSIPVVGRNLPTGVGLSVGYRVGWQRARLVDDFAAAP